MGIARNTGVANDWVMYPQQLMLHRNFCSSGMSRLSHQLRLLNQICIPPLHHLHGDIIHNNKTININNNNNINKSINNNYSNNSTYNNNTFQRMLVMCVAQVLSCQAGLF